MRVAIEGCTHGDLDRIYDSIAELEKLCADGRKVDLLLCCGDFQATRNVDDLDCMAVPDKYKDMCSFYKYYSGEKLAPVLTIFIGGNHEASNHLQELPYGGWVAPNIYYLGLAGVVSVNGVRIGGLSGIFKGHDYLTGHHEIPPYDNNTVRSVYHIRNLETFRLRQLLKHPPDIMLSHDWPRGIHKHGNLDELLRMKRFLREDIERDCLGSRPTMELLEALRPRFWFAAHLHVKFPALVPHEDGRVTKFLALDKCLPRRKFLQVIEVGPEVGAGQTARLEYDPLWLAVLKSTNHLLSVQRAQNHMPGPMYQGRYDFAPTDEEVEKVKEAFDGELAVPENFERSAKAHVVGRKREWGKKKKSARRNRQTQDFCEKLEVHDPCDLILQGNWEKDEEEEEEQEEEAEQEYEPSPMEVSSSAAGKLEDDSSSDVTASFPTFLEDTAAVTDGEAASAASNEPAAANDDKDAASSEFVIDTNPTLLNSGEEPQQKKTLKRRNLAIYEANDD